MTTHFFLLFYKGCIHLHILVSFLACFLIFPINIFNTKGSDFHKKIGRLAVPAVYVICATGFLMLINPVFPNQFVQSVSKYHWAPFFKTSLYEPILFLWLIMNALYQTISGIRIWSRIAAIKKGLPSYNALDIALMVLFSLFGWMMIGIGGIDFSHNNPFYALFLAEGIKSNLYVAFDLWILLQGPSLLVRWGWAIHGFKMISIWMGLIIAYIIRLNLTLRELDGITPMLSMLFWILPLFLVFYQEYWKHEKQSLS
ncbi:MAG: hypothetical protein ACOYK6_02615 [Chthoniobacterales bacterium]